MENLQKRYSYCDIGIVPKHSMKLFYTYDIFNEQRYGGISRYYFELIRRIPPEIADVKIMSGLYVNEYIKELPVVKGFRVPQLRYTGFIRQIANSIYQRIMLKGSNSQTIVHQTYYYEPRIKCPGKVVVTIYDMLHEIYPQYFHAADDTTLLKRQSCERADVIISISHSTKNDLIRLFGIAPEKIIVIHLSSSLKTLGPFKSGRPFHDAYILFVGVRYGHKNFEGLIKAFAASASLKNNFHVICFGGGSFSDTEHEMLKNLGIEKHVHQVSGNDELLCNYYKNALAFVCPSLYEGFGIPILEAMELSCPVICTNTSSVPEVAGDAAVYFDPSNIGSMRDALEATLFNQHLLCDLKKRGLKQQSMFSWDRCASETLAVYNSLLQ